MNIEAKVYELNQMDDGADIQADLEALTGQRTVPNVFVKGTHIGGNDDTQAAAKSGKINEMLGKWRVEMDRILVEMSHIRIWYF